VKLEAEKIFSKKASKRLEKASKGLKKVEKVGKTKRLEN
jgi:hypothetical protein